MNDHVGRLLIVDDDSLFVSTLAARFRAAGVNVVSETCSTPGIAWASTWNFDVALLSDSLLGTRGTLDAIHKIRSLDRCSTIIVRTSDEHGVTVVLALEFGADDYVTRREEATLVEARIRRALRRNYECTQCKQLQQQVSEIRQLDPEANLPELLQLTRTEERLWVALRAGKGEMVSSEVLAKAVWKRIDVEARLLYEHISNLRRKLNTRGFDISNARGEGYRLFRSATLDVTAGD